MRVLIVESELVVARALAAALESRGHDVDVARRAEEALALTPPEVLIADPELPGLTGLDLLERYRRRGFAPRTVFLSARPSLESCRRALRLGASEFLSKPFRLEELVQAVETEGCLEGARLQRSYAATLPSVEQAQLDLAAFATGRGIGPSCRARACTALGEVVENVVRHAYPCRSGELEVDAEIEGRDLLVMVSDAGVGVDGVELGTEHLCADGGLSRAAALTEGLEVRTEDGRTRVRMRFGAYRVAYAQASTDLSEHDYLSPQTTRDLLALLREGGSAEALQLSPALAVVAGRLLADPDPRRAVAHALRS